MIVCHCGDKKLSLFLRSKNVHVVRGDDEAKIDVVPEIELVYNHGLKAQYVKQALKLVKMYKDEIIAAWNEYHD